jgi:hypothetical protein
MEKIIAQSGDYLNGRVAGGMFAGITEQLGPTQTKIDSVLITLNKTLAGVDSMLDQENKQNLKVLLKNLNHTVSSFDATAKSIERTSNSANGLIAQNEQTIKKTLNNANTTLASTQATIEKFGKTADKINAMELEKTIKNFEEASKNLNSLLADINNGKGSLGKLAKEDDIADELKATIKSVNSLVDDLKKNPSRYVNISVFGKKQTIQP